MGPPTGGTYVNKPRGAPPPTTFSSTSSSSAADQAIARRRAELRRLAQQQNQQPPVGGPPPVTSTASGPPPLAPNLPVPSKVQRVRHSDLFPTVDKPRDPPRRPQLKTPPVSRRLEPDFKTNGESTNKSNNPSSSKYQLNLSSVSPWEKGASISEQPRGQNSTTTTTAAADAPPQPPTRPPPPAVQPSSSRSPPKGSPPRISEGSVYPPTSAATSGPPTPTAKPTSPPPVAPVSVEVVHTTKENIPPMPPPRESAPPPMAPVDTTDPAAAPPPPPPPTSVAPPPAETNDTNNVPPPTVKPPPAGPPPSTTMSYPPVPPATDPEPPALQSEEVPPPTAPPTMMSMTTTAASAVQVEPSSSQSYPEEPTPEDTYSYNDNNTMSEEVSAPPSETVVPAPVDEKDAGNKELDALAQEALDQKVKELEQQLREKQAENEKLLQERQLEQEKSVNVTHNNNAGAPLESFLEMVDSVGEAQAVEWARSQVSGNVEELSTNDRFRLDTITPHKSNRRPHVGFASPMPASPALGVLTPGPRPPRAATPHPRRDLDLSDADTERQNHAYFIDAATLVPFEYETEIATFCVRRPYGLEDPPDLFADCSLVDPDTYGRRAHVSEPSSLEVVAMIPADASYLVLSGESNVRIYNTYDGEWREYNIDEMDRPLGLKSYIDDNALEQEYSLDEIYDGAVLSRQDYCSTLYSTALSLRDRPAPALNGEPQQHDQQHGTMSPPPQQKSPTRDAAVNTDKHVPMEEPKNDKSSDASSAPQKTITKSPPPPAAPDSSDGGIISWIVASIFGLIWAIVWKLPLAVIRSTIVAVGTTFVLTILWMYLEDGAGSQASFGLYNTRGIM